MDNKNIIIMLKNSFNIKFEKLYSYVNYYSMKLRAYKGLGISSINILLFIATFSTTFYVGGPWYAISIMTILLAHELGHFFMCRKYKVEATPPYFLPVPIQPFGTFGALIKMKGQIPDKKALFDIGAAGPIAGLVFAIPAIIIGLFLSTVVPTTGMHYMQLGEPLLFKFISNVMLGTIPDGYDLLLHPVAYAGWAGLFVTALNLMPIGQLDGGHIVYALLGKKSKLVFLIGIIIFCLIAAFVYYGWVVFAILLLIFGFKHPAPLDDVTKIDPKRRIIGIVMFIVFLLSFTPIPMKF